MPLLSRFMKSPPYVLILISSSAVPEELREEIEWLALEATKLMGLDIAGVDLLFDNGGYTICEVNSSPGFTGLESCSKKNIAEHIVQYVKMRIGGFNE